MAFKLKEFSLFKDIDFFKKLVYFFLFLLLLKLHCRGFIFIFPRHKVNILLILLTEEHKIKQFWDLVGFFSRFSRFLVDLVGL